MSATTIYHRLGPGNAQRLRHADVFDNPIDPDQLENFLADDSHELVFATSGNAVVGFASGAVLFHPDKPPAFFINEIDVAPASQRQGIGTALCRMLIGVARDRGCKGIWLVTEADNTAANALYRRLDAQETRAVVLYDWDGAMGALSASGFSKASD